MLFITSQGDFLVICNGLGKQLTHTISD